MPSHSYATALGCAKRLTDAEIFQLHREVSRLARAAYGRQPRYQENYRNSMPAARAKLEAARLRASAARSSSAAVESAP